MSVILRGTRNVVFGLLCLSGFLGNASHRDYRYLYLYPDGGGLHSYIFITGLMYSTGMYVLYHWVNKSWLSTFLLRCYCRYSPGWRKCTGDGVVDVLTKYTKVSPASALSPSTASEPLKNADPVILPAGPWLYVFSIRIGCRIIRAWPPVSRARFVSSFLWHPNPRLHAVQVCARGAGTTLCAASRSIKAQCCVVMICYLPYVQVPHY